MNVGFMFLAVAVAALIWWLILQRLLTKPWLEQGVVEEGSSSATRYPASAVGLGVFLVVVTSLFALFASAYLIRMTLPDWRPMPEPGILWINTVILVLASMSLQWAWSAGNRVPTLADSDDIHRARDIRRGLVGGGVFALLFLLGQLEAWREMAASGYLVSGNPANTFFYLLTALHGLHLLGGIWVLSRAAVKSYGIDLAHVVAEDLVLKIKLCAVYWHYLLLLWLGLFGLMLST